MRVVRLASHLPEKWHRPNQRVFYGYLVDKPDLPPDHADYRQRVNRRTLECFSISDGLWFKDIYLPASHLPALPPDYRGFRPRSVHASADFFRPAPLLHPCRQPPREIFRADLFESFERVTERSVHARKILRLNGRWSVVLFHFVTATRAQVLRPAYRHFIARRRL